MKIKTITADEYADIPETFNPPVILDESAANAFQLEMANVYNDIYSALQRLGKEGDNYGIADYAIRPSPSGKYPNSRHFSIVIMSRRFISTAYLPIIYNHLRSSSIEYRVEIVHDTGATWIELVLITCKDCLVYCDNTEKRTDLVARLKGVFAC